MLVRDGAIAELGAPGCADGAGRGGCRRRGGAAPLPGLRRPARPPAHARPGVQGDARDRHAPRPRPAASAGSSRCRTPSPTLDDAPGLRSLCAQAERDARVPVGFLPAITRGLQGEELTEMAELRDAGALGFTDDGKPVVAAGMLRTRAPVPAAVRRRARPARGGPVAVGARRDARGRGLGASRDGGDPVDLGVDDGRARRRDRRLRGRAGALPAPLLRRVGRGARGLARRPARGSAARPRRTT